MPDENVNSDPGQQTEQQAPGGQAPEGQAPDVQQPNNIDALLKISNATTLEDAIKWAENANSRLGNSITLPSEPDAEANRLIQEKLLARGYDVMLKPDPSNPESLESIREMMGTPKEIDGYELPEPTDTLQYDPDAANSFKQIAHKYGLPQEAFQGIIQDMALQNMDAYAKHSQSQYDELTTLKSELGYAYDEKVAEATNWMKVINPEYDPKNATAGEIRGMLRLTEKLGSMASEGQNFQRPSESNKITPNDAKAKIVEVMDKMNGLDYTDPKYKLLMNEKRELYRLAYPEGAEPDGTARIGGIKFA